MIMHNKILNLQINLSIWDTFLSSLLYSSYYYLNRSALLKNGRHVYILIVILKHYCQYYLTILINFNKTKIRICENVKKKKNFTSRERIKAHRQIQRHNTLERRIMMTTLSVRDESFFLYCPCLSFSIIEMNAFAFSSSELVWSLILRRKITDWLEFLCVFILDSVCISQVSWEQVSHLCSALPVNYWTVNEGGKSYLTTHVLPLSRSSHFTLHPLLSVTPLPHYISVTRFPAQQFDTLP